MPANHSSDQDTAAPTTDDGATGTTTSSTYKVLGELDAASGTGVLGNNTADGDVTSGTHPRGVTGRTTGSGVTYGVYGRGTSSGARGVVGDATKAGDTSPTSGGVPAGVIGITDRSSADAGVSSAIGVGGTHTAASGTGYGALGRTDSADGYGVLGSNAADSGGPVAVRGVVPNASGGYGLSTPNDASIGGTLETATVAIQSSGGLTDASGNSHLTVNDGGPLAAGQPLDLRGNALLDSGTTIWDGTNGADVVTETASTFGEPDVSVSHSRTRVSNGAIELDSYSVSRPADDGSASDSTPLGLEFEPQVDLPAITATVSSDTSGESTVGLYDGNGNQLTSEPSPGAGNSVTLTGSMSAGQRYYVLVDDNGSSYTAGSYSSPSFPYRSSPLYITAGAGDDSGTIFTRSNTVWTISKLEIGFGGSATVAFPRPSSVGHWRTVTFQDEPDGETVEVYVETSSDGGTTWSDWQSKPVGSGTDLAGIPAGNYVRFRVELSRDDLANNPRLRLLSRQYSP